MPGLNDFTGQTGLKELIQSKIRFAKASVISLPHLLISGEEEMGKMTFASAIADEMGMPFRCLAAENLVKILDLSGELVNVAPRQILAIRNVEVIRPAPLDLLAQAVSSFSLGIKIGDRTHNVSIPHFTLIGTTTKPWSVDERIRRWCTSCTFVPYTSEELSQIVLRIATGKGVSLDTDAASDIAGQCRRPGEAEVLIQRISGHLPPGIKYIDRPMLRQLNEFLGSGNLYPETLNVSDQIRAMDGIEFEHWVADLFRKAGFQVEVTQASGDHGVDLWASLEGRRVAVQCKRWDGTVGEPVLRDLYGTMMGSSAHCGCLITTGSFTTQAHQFAEGKPLHLVGMDTVMEAVTSPSCLRQLLKLV